MKKTVLIIFCVIVCVVLGVYFYTYKNHRDIATEQADYSLSLVELQKEFQNNDSLFNAKYADKTIEIYGKITNVDLNNHSIMIDEKIEVNFKDSIEKNIKAIQATKIKGRFVGYDDLLEEFKIDQAILVK